MASIALDELVLNVFKALYGQEWNEEEDGAGCLDPIYEHLEDLLQRGLSENEAVIQTVDYFR